MPKRQYTHAEKRAFRSAVAKLKRAGLVSPLIDARKAAIESTGLQAAVKRFKDVVRGTAVTLKTSRLKAVKASDLREQHLKISKPAGLPQRVIVPKFPDEKVNVKAGTIQYVSPEGIRRLTLPKVRDDTLGHFFADLKASKIKLPDTRKGEYFAARFYSGRTVPFRSMRELLDKLRTYQTIKAASTRADVQDVLRNLEIVTIGEGQPRTDWMKWKKTHKRHGRKPKNYEAKIVPAYIVEPRKNPTPAKPAKPRKKKT